MRLFLEDLWYRAIEAPGNTWAWFNALNREEWLVVLTITCAPAASSACLVFAGIAFKSAVHLRTRK